MSSNEESTVFQPKFSADGLIPAIATDSETGVVLMVLSRWVDANYQFYAPYGDVTYYGFCPYYGSDPCGNGVLDPESNPPTLTAIYDSQGEPLHSPYRYYIGQKGWSARY